MNEKNTNIYTLLVTNEEYLLIMDSLVTNEITTENNIKNYKASEYVNEDNKKIIDKLIEHDTNKLNNIVQLKNSLRDLIYS